MFLQLLVVIFFLHMVALLRLTMSTSSYNQSGRGGLSLWCRFVLGIHVDRDSTYRYNFVDVVDHSRYVQSSTTFTPSCGN